MTEAEASQKARRPQGGDLEPLLELLWDGKSLRAACLKLGLHTPSVSDWIHSDESAGGRREQYLRACEGRADYLQEDALTVNRAAALGMEVDDRKVEPSGARGYLDAVKWSTARMAPKTAPVERHEHTGRDGGPIRYANLSREDRQSRIAELERRRAERSGGA